MAMPRGSFLLGYSIRVIVPVLGMPSAKMRRLIGNAIRKADENVVSVKTMTAWPETSQGIDKTGNAMMFLTVKYHGSPTITIDQLAAGIAVDVLDAGY